jgi:hypothetical protein
MNSFNSAASLQNITDLEHVCEILILTEEFAVDLRS